MLIKILENDIFSSHFMVNGYKNINKHNIRFILYVKYVIDTSAHFH